MKVRLPWPFGRSTAAPADTTADRPGPVAPAVAPAVARPPSTGAWATLPPIQRAVGKTPLVASSAAFLAAVPGVHPLPPIVEPLGHDVTPVAPAGLVAAPVHVTSSLTSSASLVPPRVQRRTGASSEPAPSEPTVPAAAVDAPSAAAAAPAGVSAETVPVDPPARQLGVVTPAATVRPPDRPLTRAEPPATKPDRNERPLAGRRTQVQTSRAGTSDTPAAAGPAGGAGTPTPDRAAAAPATPLGSPAPERRAGLGTPLPAAPSTAVPADARSLPGLTLARMAPGMATPSATEVPRPAATMRTDAGGPRETSPTAGSAPLRTTIQRRMTGPRPASPEPGDSGTEDAPQSDLAVAAAIPRATAISPSPSLPVLRVVGQPRAGEGGAAGADGTLRGAAAGSSAAPTTAQMASRGASSGATVTVSRTAGKEPAAIPSARPQRRPLAGSQPIGQVGAVQRLAAPNGAPSPATAGPTARDGGSTSSSLAPAIFGGSQPDTLIGQSWTLPGWESSGPALTPDPTVQRQTASDWPLPAGPGADLRAGRRPSGRSDGGPTPSTSMALARPAGPAVTSMSDTGGAPPTVARSIASDAGGPHVQTVAAFPPVQGPVFGPTATPIVQRIDGSPPPAPEPRGAQEHSDEELDELARSLFGRLRNRLRSEYIYEREAKGLTFDQS